MINPMKKNRVYSDRKEMDIKAPICRELLPPISTGIISALMKQRKAVAALTYEIENDAVAVNK